MTRTYAPVPAADPAFDRIMESVHEAMAADPEASKYSEPARREVIARALATHGKRTFATSDGWHYPDDEPEAEPAPQTVQGVELTIPPAGEPYWYDDPVQARVLDHYILAKRSLGAAMHSALLITGPSGAGKTQSVAVAVERLNAAHGLSLTLHKFDCAATTDAGKWMGRREIDAAGSHFYESDLMVAMRAPDSVILLDEINRLHPTLTNLIMPLLDGSRALHISDMNVTVPVHETAVFIATANIGAGFGGTHRFDQALRERFGYTIERDFPPRDEEIKVVAGQTGCDLDAAAVLVDIAESTRALHATGDLRSPISTRTLVGAGWLVASGFTEREALKFTALPLYDGGAEGTIGTASERARVEAILQGKG